MALYSNAFKRYNRILPPCALLYRHLNTTRTCSDKAVTLEIDTFDDLTSNLIQKHSCKWDRIQARSKLYDTNNPPTIGSDNPDSLFLEAVKQENNLLRLIEECVNSKQTIPSTAVLRQILCVSAQKGYCRAILSLKELCCALKPNYAESNANFNHYLAEAVWIRGDVTKSLQLFETVYAENKPLRRYIRMVLNHLFLNKLTERSEASLLTVIQFSERVDAVFGDPYFLVAIWQVCFLSDWFTDQCIALEMLESNEMLLKNVNKRLPLLVNDALGGHRTEVVYRLLEVLLKREMACVYSLVLEALFDYRLRERDFHGCREILQWSRNNSVRLPSFQVEQFLQLSLSDDLVETNVRSITKRVKYRFKF